MDEIPVAKNGERAVREGTIPELFNDSIDHNLA